MLKSKTFLTTGIILPLISSILCSPVFAAGSSQTITRSAGTAATAFWPGPGPVGQLSNIELDVSKTSTGTDIVLFADAPTCLGCRGELTTTPDLFQTNALDSARLSPVNLKMCLATDQFGNCTQSMPLTIQASWTGLGTPTTSMSKLKQVGGGGHLIFTGPATFRAATATGNLKGHALGQAADARLIKFTQVIIEGQQSKHNPNS